METGPEIDMATWRYQVRIHLTDATADLARSDPANARLDALSSILTRYRATMKCQYDAFVEYVNEAEAQGIERYALYHWTKNTVEDEAKSRKHRTVFTVYVDGEEVYPKEIADVLETDLTELAARDDSPVAHIVKYDTNPANNPQPPTSNRR